MVAFEDGSIGDAVVGAGAMGCMTLWTAIGCLVQLGAAVIGLAVVVGLFRACASCIG
jgi:hypothetical protein